MTDVRDLEVPQRAGTLSAAMTAELRQRKVLVADVESEVRDLESRLARKRMLANVVRHEMRSFLAAAIAAEGLDTRHRYAVDDDTGIITMTGIRDTAEAEIPASAPKDVP